MSPRRRNLRRGGTARRYYRGPMQTPALPDGQLEPPAWVPPRQEKASLGGWEWFWLALLVLSSLVAVALPLWPGAPWPRTALYMMGATLLGIFSILGFFVTYVRARAS